MTFYQPRFFAQQQPQQASYGQSSGNRFQAQNPMNATTNVPQQPSNPLDMANNAVGAYKSGKGVGNMITDASNLYDRWTMPSMVNSGGITSPMMTPSVASGSFMSGSGAMASPLAAESSAPYAANLALDTSGPGYGLLSSGATAAPSWLSGLSGVGADAALGSTTGAATEALGSAAATSGAEAAGGMGLEAAGLGALGPIGILAGAGLLGSKLLGFW